MKGEDDHGFMSRNLLSAPKWLVLTMPLSTHFFLSKILVQHRRSERYDTHAQRVTSEILFQIIGSTAMTCLGPSLRSVATRCLGMAGSWESMACGHTLKWKPSQSRFLRRTHKEPRRLPSSASGRKFNEINHKTKKNDPCTLKVSKEKSSHRLSWIQRPQNLSPYWVGVGRRGHGRPLKLSQCPASGWLFRNRLECVIPSLWYNSVTCL